MPLFARMHPLEAEDLIDSWPHHRWHYRSIQDLLNYQKEHNNDTQIEEITLNEPLLESIKEGGFVNPFLVTHTWYPICGSQRLRAALELPEEVRKNTVVRVCRFTQPVWKPLFKWPDKEESMKAAQIWFQMAEVVFKTVYCVPKDKSGQEMLFYEEFGNKLHWDIRDGKKK